MLKIYQYTVYINVSSSPLLKENGDLDIERLWIKVGYSEHGGRHRIKAQQLSLYWYNMFDLTLDVKEEDIKRLQKKYKINMKSNRGFEKLLHKMFALYNLKTNAERDCGHGCADENFGIPHDFFYQALQNISKHITGVENDCLDEIYIKNKRNKVLSRLDVDRIKKILYERDINCDKDDIRERVDLEMLQMRVQTLEVLTKKLLRGVKDVQKHEFFRRSSCVPDWGDTLKSLNTVDQWVYNELCEEYGGVFSSYEWGEKRRSFCKTKLYNMYKDSSFYTQYNNQSAFFRKLMKAFLSTKADGGTGCLQQYQQHGGARRLVVAPKKSHYSKALKKQIFYTNIDTLRIAFCQYVKTPYNDVFPDFKFHSSSRFSSAVKCVLFLCKIKKKKNTKKRMCEKNVQSKIDSTTKRIRFTTVIE